MEQNHRCDKSSIFLSTIGCVIIELILSWIMDKWKNILLIFCGKINMEKLSIDKAN